ncbi:MAG: ABC transporter substrate-binding protein [Saprospiraceae bacterium]|nr:ABC transporter substrate-binding protein [Saprospiraceae bacterium]
MIKSTIKCLVVFLFLLFISSCIEDKNNVIRFSSWQSNPSEKRLTDSLLSTFTKKYPDSKVKFELIPGNYSEKIQLMLGTHSAPQIFYIKDWLAPSYLRYDVLQPLDDFILQDTTFDKNDFYPQFLEAFTKNGKLYGIPKDFGPFVLFYNEEMFREAGITEPPKDWKELEDYCRKLTKDTNGDGKIDQYGLVIEPSIDKLMPFVFQNEGGFQDKDGNLTINAPEFKEALAYYYGLFQKKIATIPSEVSMNNLEEVFGRKRSAMVISGGWFIPQLKDQFKDVQYKIAYLPKGKQMATISFTVAYSSAKENPLKDQSWKLMSYLTGKEGMKIWTSTGIAMPTRKSVALALDYNNHPIYKYFMGSVEFAKVFQVDYNERWYSIVQSGMQAIFYEKADIDQTIKQMEDDIKPLKINK